MKLETLYKKTNGGKTQMWEVEIDGNKHRVISGQTDGKKVVSEWTVCVAKNEGKANATTPEEQALNEAKAMHKKKLEGGYFLELDRAEAGEKKFHAPMLAKEFEPDKHPKNKKFFTQPKLDGVRCLVSKEGMFSRNGKEILSAPHIYKELQHIFVDNPDLVLDGELYNHIYHDNFNKIVSLVKKTKPTEDDLKTSEDFIQYWCYDYMSNDSFSERKDFLKNNVFNKEYKSVFLLETDEVNSLEEIYEKYGNYVDNGYEGQMVRDDKPYEIGKRSKFLMKHKSFQDAEYLILDVVEGQGNKSGMAGYVILKNNDGNTFKSNIKGDRDYCRELLSNKNNYIGKMGTIKFFMLTPDGVPRFPYLINIGRDSYE